MGTPLVMQESSFCLSGARLMSMARLMSFIARLMSSMANQVI